MAGGGPSHVPPLAWYHTRGCWQRPREVADGTTTLVSALPTHRTSYRVSPHPTTRCGQGGQAAIAIAILMINRPMMLWLFPLMSPPSRRISQVARIKVCPTLL